MWCGSCKKAWNWREAEIEKGKAERMKCNACGGRDIIEEGAVKWNEKKKYSIHHIEQERRYIGGIRKEI